MRFEINVDALFADEFVERGREGVLSEEGWRPIPRQLTYSVRYALDVAISLDVERLEMYADHNAMMLLSMMRSGRARPATPAEYRALREGNPHLWRLWMKETNRC